MLCPRRPATRTRLGLWPRCGVGPALLGHPDGGISAATTRPLGGPPPPPSWLRHKASQLQAAEDLRPVPARSTGGPYRLCRSSLRSAGTAAPLQSWTLVVWLVGRRNPAATTRPLGRLRGCPLEPGDRGKPGDTALSVGEGRGGLVGLPLSPLPSLPLPLGPGSPSSALLLLAWGRRGGRPSDHPWSPYAG